MSGEQRTFSVIHGQLQVPDSWVYLWVSKASGLVIYIGATRLDPEVRAWMHLHDENRNVGRVRADYADYKTEAMDVFAFAVPPGIDRAAVRDGLTRAASAAGMLALDNICRESIDGDVDPEVDEVVSRTFVELAAAISRQGGSGEDDSKSSWDASNTHE